VCNSLWCSRLTKCRTSISLKEASWGRKLPPARGSQVSSAARMVCMHWWWLINTLKEEAEMGATGARVPKLYVTCLIHGAAMVPRRHYPVISNSQSLCRFAVLWGSVQVWTKTKFPRTQIPQICVAGPLGNNFLVFPAIGVCKRNQDNRTKIGGEKKSGETVAQT
jgi:hypothetical protein